MAIALFPLWLMVNCWFPLHSVGLSPVCGIMLYVTDQLLEWLLRICDSSLRIPPQIPHYTLNLYFSEGVGYVAALGRHCMN